MFKNKIAVKLTLYFASALLVFTFVIGSVFIVLFKDHIIEVHKAELEKRAAGIAQTLSGFISNNNSGRQMGYGFYIRFLEDIAMADVWIVDQNLELITRGQGMGAMGRQFTYSDLPADAENIVAQVFQGETAFSEDFSTLLNAPTLTVGTPIISGNDEIIGVVLLHSPVEGINEAVAKGYTILAVSILVALIIAFLLSIRFSITFTRPLKKMQNTALLLAEGDYTIKNDIQQNDEIGELAVSLDILTDRLNEASRQNEKLEQLRRDFTANISHELRTPVTVMRGSLEALCDGVVTDPEQVGSYHQQMLFEAIFLERLVGDLLDLSKLQNIDFAIEKQDVNIFDVIDDVVRSMRPVAEQKGIRIEAEKDNSNSGISGDYGRLRQMVMIILDNAVKFSPENGVVKITFTNRILTIEDNGAGIPQEDLPHIFDRFYKSRSEQNKAGTGLGLAIATQIADRHGIDIIVKSEPKVKTQFRLYLDGKGAH